MHPSTMGPWSDATASWGVALPSDLEAAADLDESGDEATLVGSGGPAALALESLALESLALESLALESLGLEAYGLGPTALVAPDGLPSQGPTSNTIPGELAWDAPPSSDDPTHGSRPADDLETSMDSRSRSGGRAASVGVELAVERSEVRLAPSGKSVEERYVLLGELGRGGMGRVLKARDTDIGREVAIKALLPTAQSDPRQIRRFWTEVQATGQLEHPSIIPIHDVGRLPTGELFYVMKKLGGSTLSDLLVRLRLSDESTVHEFTRLRLLTIFQQIAYAVAFAHARGVVHRDIKPANIMVGDYGEAILLDWGLAKVMGRSALDRQGSTSRGEHSRGRGALGSRAEEDAPVVRIDPSRTGGETVAGTITGTPQYMSPEATEGVPERVGPKSDVYGLGAVLYELLTYTPPFQDLGFVPTVVKVRQHEFVPPRAKAPDAGISVELEELCLLAMNPDPDQRPSARALADEVGRIMEGTKERERRSGKARDLVREGRRATDHWKSLKVELQSAESEARRLAREIPVFAAPVSKEPMWQIEDRVSELKIEAIGAFEEAESAFLRALGEVSEHREARQGLAALYFARFGEAERARDVEEQRYYRRLVSRFDDGEWSKVLTGDGTLEVVASDPDAEISIAHMELKGRVLRPGARRALGRGAVPRFEIPIGSYVLGVRSRGEREIQRPVLIGRNDAVSVHVRCRRSTEVGDEFVLVPAGPAIIGGDPMASGSLDRHVVEVGEFAIARFPVTCDEYRAFLDALAKNDVEESQRRAPRARPLEGRFWRFDERARSFDCSHRCPDGHIWSGHLPVSGVSMRDALAYAEWRSSQTNAALRLPTELEWEKAARGVDGRFFPWGDHFDPTFCKMKDSRNRAYPEPEPVGAFPTDCSPYGARDMAGGIREICIGEEGGHPVPVMRGGSWLDPPHSCRVTSRQGTKADFTAIGLGFRLARDLSDATHF